MGDTSYGIGGFISTAPGVLKGNNPPPPTFRGKLGQFYYDFSTTFPNLYIYNGTSWILTNFSIDSFPITPFVVGPSVEAQFQTIQSAINAAELGSGGIIYIQPGTYIENITITGQNIFLVGYIGCDGNIGISVTGGETLPVTIQGNLTLNLVNLQTTPFLNFKNICFVGGAGNIFTITGNLNLLESGFINFDNCQIIANSLATNIFFVNGFFNIGVQGCEIFEAIPNTVNFFTFGTTQFLNLNSRDSFININAQNALSVVNSFMVFNLENTYYNTRIDVSSGSQAFSFTALNCVFDPSPISNSSPLINFGGNSGSITANNCVILSTAGSLADSTNLSAAAFFRYNNCIWNNPLVLDGNGRGEFSFCEFYGTSSPSITFNSSQSISILNSVVNSSNNPAIAGTGGGVITVGDLTFSGSSSSIAGTLTLSYAPSLLGALTLGGKLNLLGGAQILSGVGAPTGISATQGSLYTNTTAASSTTRLYVNTTGGTTWANFTASA